LVEPLVDTPISPNQITTLRLLTAVLAAGAFAVGGSEWRIAGSLLFIFSFVLDRADGELARISGKTSPLGHSYDLISDACANALVFVGIGFGLTESVLGGWAALLGLLAGAAVAAILWLVIKVEESAGTRAAEIGLSASFDPDDAMLVVPLVMLFDGGVGLIIAAAIGAPLFAGFMFWKFWRQLGSATA
jgi:phosphatidylglycerophosphate synthase